MHLEVLKLKQRKIFERLNKFPEYYLVGGTGLALQIGHRLSVDFDLFSKKIVPSTLLGKLRKVFRKDKREVILNIAGQLSVEINGIRIDFVENKFPLILKPREFRGVKIVQVPEIGAMKAYTLNYRGTLKDYVDLYFILKDKYTTLQRIKEIAEKKYKSEFNFRLLLEQLVYLKDIKREDIKFLGERFVSEEEMVKSFEKEIAKIKL